MDMPIPPREISLFRNGANQALRIPRDLELPGKKVTIEPMPDGLYIRVLPQKHDTLASLLASWEPMDFDFPNVDEGMLPLDDVKL